MKKEMDLVVNVLFEEFREDFKTEKDIEKYFAKLKAANDIYRWEKANDDSYCLFVKDVKRLKKVGRTLRKELGKDNAFCYPEFSFVVPGPIKTLDDDLYAIMEDCPVYGLDFFTNSKFDAKTDGFVFFNYFFPSEEDLIDEVYTVILEAKKNLLARRG